jgi:hypothetical protein
MLGSAADADDVLQEAWLRWADVDHSEVRDPRAYLVRVVTRQALNQMRTLSRRREVFEMPYDEIAGVMGSPRPRFGRSRGAPASMWPRGGRGCGCG